MGESGQTRKVAISLTMENVIPDEGNNKYYCNGQEPQERKFKNLTRRYRNDNWREIIDGKNIKGGGGIRS
jgi:hypothetical protein